MYDEDYGYPAHDRILMTAKPQFILPSSQLATVLGSEPKGYLLLLLLLLLLILIQLPLSLCYCCLGWRGRVLLFCCCCCCCLLLCFRDFATLWMLQRGRLVGLHLMFEENQGQKVSTVHTKLLSTIFNIWIRFWRRWNQLKTYLCNFR